jgi:hypothetical protein
MTFTSKVYDGSLVSDIVESVPSKCGFLGAEVTSFSHVYTNGKSVILEIHSW